MNSFSIITVLFALFGAAIYFGIVYVAGPKGWWWLAVLVSLPAFFALLLHSRMPADLMAQSSSILFRHFRLVGIVQLVAAAAVYFFAKTRGQGPRTKGSN